VEPSLGSKNKRVSPILKLTIAFGLGFLLGIALFYGRARANRYQNEGEKLLASALRRYFPSPDYHLLNHVTLPMPDGSTQIDHILVSRFGVFVIETKHFSGWIFANAKQAKWTQVLFMRKSSFQNPIFQNLRHVRAVGDLLDFLPTNSIRSAVVFTGNAEFKTEVPEGVFELMDFIEHVRSSSVQVMSANRMQFCVGRLEAARLAISGQTDIEHIQNLERRHGGANR
jgi:hypothetical protein